MKAPALFVATWAMNQDQERRFTVIKAVLAHILEPLEFRPVKLIGFAMAVVVIYYLGGFDGRLEGREIFIGLSAVIIGSWGGGWIDDRLRTGERISAWWKTRRHQGHTGND